MNTTNPQLCKSPAGWESYTHSQPPQLGPLLMNLMSRKGVGGGGGGGVDVSSLKSGPSVLGSSAGFSRERRHSGLVSREASRLALAFGSALVTLARLRPTAGARTPSSKSQAPESTVSHSMSTSRTNCLGGHIPSICCARPRTKPKTFESGATRTLSVEAQVGSNKPGASKQSFASRSIPLASSGPRSQETYQHLGFCTCGSLGNVKLGLNWA